MTLERTLPHRWATTTSCSKRAESVTLVLYAESDIVNPALAYRFDYLKNKTGRIWHCRMPLVSMKGASHYAYSVGGPKPNGRFEWHSFDRDKILLDPYAKSVFFPPTFDGLAATGMVQMQARLPWVSLWATRALRLARRPAPPADGVRDGAPVRQEMKRVRKLVGAKNGYAYRAGVPAARPATDYTARVIPHRDGVAIPLEDARILWQR